MILQRERGNEIVYSVEFRASTHFHCYGTTNLVFDPHETLLAQQNPNYEEGNRWYIKRRWQLDDGIVSSIKNTVQGSKASIHYRNKSMGRMAYQRLKLRDLPHALASATERESGTFLATYVHIFRLGLVSVVLHRRIALHCIAFKRSNSFSK